MNSKILWLRITAISGAIVIMLGAFGAHGLKDILTTEMMTIFETGIKYHFYHTLALFALLSYSKENSLSKPLPAICMTWLFGVMVFSGSLYILAVTEIRWLGAITPIGGVAMIVGWLWLAVSARKILS